MRILLVEDQRPHAEAAIKALGDAHIPYMLAMNAKDALALLADHPFDGVITDLFMPLSMYDPNADEPCGIAIALDAEKRNIPFVICTAGYHHGTRYNWICVLGRNRGWPEMVDQESAGETGEASTKDWARAVEVLLELIEDAKTLAALNS